MFVAIVHFLDPCFLSIYCFIYYSLFFMMPLFSPSDFVPCRSIVYYLRDAFFFVFRLNSLAEMSIHFLLNFQLCRQLLTDMFVAIIHSLDPLPFTPRSLSNGPHAYRIPYTRSIPPTPMYLPSIYHNLSLRKLPS
jgi:hypothetical protein